MRFNENFYMSEFNLSKAFYKSNNIPLIEMTIAFYLFQIFDKLYKCTE